MHPIVVRLPTRDYAKLRHLADEDEREIDRQAAWLLRRALAGDTPRSAPDRALVTAGAEDAVPYEERPRWA